MEEDGDFSIWNHKTGWQGQMEPRWPVQTKLPLETGHANTWTGERLETDVGYATPRALRSDFGELSPERDSARSRLGLMKTRIIKLCIQTGALPKQPAVRQTPSS